MMEKEEEEMKGGRREMEDREGEVIVEGSGCTRMH
jgi:hypothetical protein